MIRKLSRIANIDIEDAEQLKEEFEAVKEQFDKLSEADLEGVEPSILPTRPPHTLREDTVKEGLSQQEALQRSEYTENGFFKGPKTVK